ncbi:MAG: RodZ domain-containing protein [Geobacteraceae bacterium]
MPDSAAANKHVQQLGAYLRETRETRMVTLDEAAQVTRIGKNYLAAIEGGMFDKLPNVAYTKGFLRNYARYLGLSGDEIVARYVQTLSMGGADAAERTSPGDKALVADGRPDHGPGGRGRWYLSLFLLTLVMATGYLFQKEQEVSILPPPSPQSVQPAISTPVLPNHSSARLPGGVVASDVVAGKQDEPVKAIVDKPSMGIVLRLKVNQDSRLNINIDGNISQQYDLKVGDLIEWKGEKFFTLDFDNAGSIEAEFNGRPLKSLGEPGSSVHLVLRGESPGQPENAREEPIR